MINWSDGYKIENKFGKNNALEVVYTALLLLTNNYFIEYQ